MKCEICNKNINTTKGLSVHLSQKHNFNKEELKNYYDKYLKKDDEGECYFCGKESIFKGITNGYHRICKSKECLGKTRATGTYEFLMYKYGLNKEDAIKEMNKRSDERGKLIKKSLDIKLKENPNFHKEKSHQTKEYWIKRGYTEKDAILKSSEIMKMIHKKSSYKRKKNPELYKDILTNQVGYWVKKGYSEIEAIDKIKERQSTFSLSKCIKKYGKEKGIKKWNERQIKWKNKMDKKLSETNYRKDYSMIEMDFIKEIVKKLNLNHDEHYSCLNEQYFIFNKDENFYTTYDFVLKDKKKVIEFNGDYWHCNPITYNKKFFNTNKQMYAYEIWDRDEMRINAIEEKGYEVLIIWESNYKQNKEKVIQECIDFLNK